VLHVTQKAKEVGIDNQNMDDVHQRRRRREIRANSKQWNLQETELHGVDSCWHHHHRKMMNDKERKKFPKKLARMAAMTRLSFVLL